MKQITLEEMKQRLPSLTALRLAYVTEGILPDVQGQTELPPFLRLEAELSPEHGSFIRIEIWLPENWSGILVGTGNGGMAGGIPHASLAAYLKQGHAAVTTDLGTSRGMESGIGNPAVWRDFGWRASHLMTLAAREAISLVYGRVPDYAYFVGGSTGGQQALSLAQRFPEDYDGIIAGAPANNRVRLHTYFLWCFQNAKDAEHRPLFDEELGRRITEAALAFRGADGERYVTESDLTPEDATAFAAFAARRCGLSAEQTEALRKVCAGPFDPRTGERIYCGAPLGSETLSCGLVAMANAEACPHSYLFYWALGLRGVDPLTFDFGWDLDRVIERLSPEMDANDPDLTPFFSRGGKLIIATGTADAVVPAADARVYLRRVREATPSLAATSLRFYTIPSRDHAVAGCSTSVVTGEGGESLFQLLRRWRESGDDPGALIAKTLPIGAQETVPLRILPN